MNIKFFLGLQEFKT